jgi:hypothetical protein
MPIDSCPYGFDQLASRELPKYYKELVAAKETAFDARIFTPHRSASKRLLGQLGRGEDFPGCYAMYEGDKAMYVGRSKHVVRRLTQHLCSSSPNSATLAYKLAKKERRARGNPDRLMENPEFKAVFDEKQRRLQAMRVAFVPISDPVTMYVFEVYAAMKLDAEWNHFYTY